MTTGFGWRRTTDDELWRSTVEDPTATTHFEKVLDFPTGLHSPGGITSHADRLWVANTTNPELWRSTVAEPHPRVPLREGAGLLCEYSTSHQPGSGWRNTVDGELWRSTVEDPTTAL